MKRISLFLVLVFSFCLLLSYPTSATAQEDIVLGCPLPTTFLYGWVAEKGIKLAVDEINAKGGVNVGGKKRFLRVEVVDTQDLNPKVSAEEVLQTVENLIVSRKVDFLMGGPARSEVALKGLDLLNKHKKISILTTGVLTPGYHKMVAENYDKYKYGFRITSHVLVMGKEFLTLVEQIRDKFGYNKIFIMVQDVAHAKKGGGLMKKLFTEKGFEVTGMEVYPTGSVDYVDGLSEANKKGSQILFLWMDHPESGILLRKWSTMKLNMLPMGFVCAGEQPNFWDVTNGEGAYLLVNLVNGGNAPANITPWTMRFANAYKKKWGIEPEGYGTSSSYMSVYMLKEAIEKANSLDPDAVIKALEDTDMMGVYGRMRFDKKSHQIIPSLDPNEGVVTCIIQWQNGRRVQVFPPKVADGEIMLPQWIK